MVGGRGRYKGSPPPGRWRDPRRAGSSAPQGQDPTSPGPTDPEGGCAEAQPVELGVFGSPTPTPRPISTLTRQTSQAWGPARTPESRPVLAAPSLWPDLPRAHTPWTEARPCLEASLQRADGRRMEVTGDRGLGQAPGLSSDTPSSLWMKEQNCSHLDPSKGPAVPMLTHTRTCRPELTRCPLEHAPPPQRPCADPGPRTQNEASPTRVAPPVTQGALPAQHPQTEPWEPRGPPGHPPCGWWEAAGLPPGVPGLDPPQAHCTRNPTSSRG